MFNLYLLLLLLIMYSQFVILDSPLTLPWSSVMRKDLPCWRRLIAAKPGASGRHISTVANAMLLTAPRTTSGLVSVASACQACAGSRLIGKSPTKTMMSLHLLTSQKARAIAAGEKVREEVREKGKCKVGEQQVPRQRLRPRPRPRSSQCKKAAAVSAFQREVCHLSTSSRAEFLRYSGVEWSSSVTSEGSADKYDAELTMV